MGYNQNHAGIHLLPKGSKGTMNFSGEKEKYTVQPLCRYLY